MKTMKLIVLTLLIQVTACSEQLSSTVSINDNRPISAGAAIQFAHQTLQADIPLSANLSAVNTTSTITINGVETPINNGPIATAAYGTLNLMPSIDGTIINYTADISGIGSNVEKVHIHLGHPTGQGPVLFSLHDIANDGPFENPKQGTLTLADLKLDPIAQTIEDLGISDVITVIENLQRGNAYVNIHSTAFPNGELRGQVVIANNRETN